MGKPAIASSTEQTVEIHVVASKQVLTLLFFCISSTAMAGGQII